jgi:pilus assembly protein CpaF
MLEIILTAVSAAVGVGIAVLLYNKRKNERKDVVIAERMTFDRLLSEIKTGLVEMVKDEYTFGKTDIEWENAYKRKKRIKTALKNCVFGFEDQKIIVQDLIREVISKQLPDEEAISDLVDFNSVSLSPYFKWEVLMYILKKRKNPDSKDNVTYGKDALPYIIRKYKWDNPRRENLPGMPPNKTNQVRYFVSTADLNFVYDTEIAEPLTYAEQLDVLAVYMFTKYKGFGCIDTLREQNIDGINFGTSGQVMDTMSELPKSTRSVWIYHDGKYIHFDFLEFPNTDEIRRVILLLVMYRSPGPLTEKRGYIVNTMYDKSRVLAIRPPAGECWAIFIRKFNLKKIELRELYVKGDDTVNADLPVTLIEYFIAGLVNIAFTGRQGSGKTTAMIGSFGAIDPRYTLRVLEMTPELYLRDRYPDRNIFSVAETLYQKPAELQDALKKSDAAISIVGEVATAAVAARMVEMGLTASICTFFSHHAVTAEGLVTALRNCLMEAGGFNNETVAEQQVLDVLRIDVHIDFDVEGFRYIERITQIIPADDNAPYPELDKTDVEYSKAKIEAEYYRRITDRKSFETRDIVRFNKETKKYEAKYWLSEELTQYILNTLPKEKRVGFADFVTANWGGYNGTV